MKRRLVLSVICFLGGTLRAQQTTPAVDPYVQWATQKWGAAVVGDPTKQAAVWGQDADPDVDGYTNLQEYAFGTDPTSYNPDPVTWDATSPVPGYYAITFSQRADDAALVIYPQYSGDMDLWSPLSPRDSFSYFGPDNTFFKYAESPVANGMKTVTYLCTIPIGSNLGGSPNLFTRLKVLRSSSQASDSSSDSLNLFDSVSGVDGAWVDSNPVTLTGFVGSVLVTAAGGAHLIVNGVDVNASSAQVSVGSTVSLRVQSSFGGNPAGGTVAYTLTVALPSGAVTKTWKVITQPIPGVTGIAGTTAGYTPVTTNVTPNGASNFSLPITVPPGTAGMEPKLAISYLSQAGNGALGVGFSVTGFSSITRAGRVAYLDGIKGGVGFNANDRFALDGQRLVPASGSDGTQFRTEQESFAKITAQGTATTGPQAFVVQAKGGLTYEYGTSANSQILANRFSGDTAVLTWPLTRIRDAAGNSVEFTYATPTDTDKGYPRVVGIVYTLNAQANPNPSEQVIFTYENRPDVRTSYVGGAKVIMSQRLTAIQCQVGTQIARRYELAYQQSEVSGNSQLVSVTEKGKQPTDGTAWPLYQPTTFLWDQKPAANMSLVTDAQAKAFDQMSLSKSPPSLLVQGDFRGDGHMGVMKFDDHYQDTWVATGNSDGTFTFNVTPAGFTSADTINPSTACLRTGDYNGDGKTDVLYLSTTGSNNWVALSNGDGTFTVKRGSDLGALQGVAQTGDYRNEVFALDLDGDGRTDIVVLNNNGKNRVFLCAGNGSFAEKPVASNDPFRNFKIAPDNDGTNTFLVPGDFNGDGLGDILLLYATGAANQMALSNGDGTFTILSGSQLGSVASTPFRRTRSAFVSGGFNGDGLTELVHLDNNDKDTNPAWAALSKGDGSFDTITRPASLQGLPLDLPTSHLLTGDFNGDGFADLFNASYYPEYTSSWQSFSEGNANFLTFLNGQMGVLDNAYYDPASRNTAASFVFVGDFDGDGFDDVLDLRDRGPNVFLARSNGFNADRVAQVTNGQGGYIKFAYKPLTDPSVYTKGTGATWPNYDVIGAIYVVSSVAVGNGMNIDAFTGQNNSSAPDNVTTYTYEQAHSLLDGHGYQGFAAVQSTNQQTFITNRTEYFTGDPTLVGRPTRQAQTLQDGTLIGEIINSWASKVTSSFSSTANGQTHIYQAFFPYTTQTVTKAYEINNGKGSAPIKTTTVNAKVFDDFGNLKQSLTDYGGGFTEQTTSTYLNDTAHWWLGRLTDTVVTKTSPGPVTASRESTFAYSSTTGQLNQEVIVTKESNLSLEKDYVRDAFGNITQSTLTDLSDPKHPRTTQMAYTPDGRFVSQITNALGQVEKRQNDPLDGTLTLQTGPNNLSTKWIYDAFGRQTNEIRPDSTQTYTQYLTASGNGVPPRAVHCIRSQSSGSGPTTIYFDILDRKIRQDSTGFDGGTVSTHTVYDPKGEAIYTSLPFSSSAAAPTAPIAQYTANIYDPIGRVTSQTVPGALTGPDQKPRTTITAYAGLNATVTNPANQTFQTTVDPQGQLASGTSFTTDTVTDTHDPFGNLTKVDDGNGHVTSMLYDERGNKRSMTDPDSGTTLYGYNAFGELTSQTDASGRVTTLSYDLLGRLVQRDEPGAPTITVAGQAVGFPEETDWIYDTAPGGVGKVASVYRKSDGYTESYEYKSYGRLATTRTQLGTFDKKSGINYDVCGRPWIVRYPNGFGIRNTYTTSGFLAAVLDADTGFQYWTASSVNARGQVVQEQFGNGLSTLHGYDANTGLPQSIQTGSGNGTGFVPTVQNFGYSFNNLNSLTETQDLIRVITEDYQYDLTNQLAGVTCTAADPVTVSCDHLGRIATRSDVGTYNYDPAKPHAVISITGANKQPSRSLVYNAVGNCVQDGGVSLTFNAANQPVSILGSTSSSVQGGSIYFEYTPARTLLRRLERTNGAATNRLYIGSLYEHDDGPAGTTDTCFIPAASGVVAIHTQTQVSAGSKTIQTSYVHKDHLGSVQMLTDENGKPVELLKDASGNSVFQFDYDAWGQRRIFNATTKRFTPTGAASETTDRGFTGHEMLDGMGLIHMNGRIYDPTIGRFLSADPTVQRMGDLQSLNRYTYVLNNPLSLSDPSGFDDEDPDLGGDDAGTLGSQDGPGERDTNNRDNTYNQSTSFNVGTYQFLGHSFGSAYTGITLDGGSIGDASLAAGSTTDFAGANLTSFGSGLGFSGSLNVSQGGVLTKSLVDGSSTNLVAQFINADSLRVAQSISDLTGLQGLTSSPYSSTLGDQGKAERAQQIAEASDKISLLDEGAKLYFEGNEYIKDFAERSGIALKYIKIADPLVSTLDITSQSINLLETPTVGNTFSLGLSAAGARVPPFGAALAGEKIILYGAYYGANYIFGEDAVFNRINSFSQSGFYRHIDDTLNSSLIPVGNHSSYPSYDIPIRLP